MADGTTIAVWIRIVVWLTLAAVLVAVLAGPMNRFGLVGFRGALSVLSAGVVAAGIGAVLCLIAAIVTRPGTGNAGFGFALTGLIAGAALVAVALTLLQTAKSVPPIHDISTDTDNPPQFVAILPLRKDAANPPEYAGPEVAAQQKAAYSDIRTLTLPVEADELFLKTLGAAKSLGWAIVATEPRERRIEATATTAWFGFKDDIVIRIAPAAEGATIDVRSKSRVGMSDLGANAARIRKLLEKVQE